MTAKVKTETMDVLKEILQPMQSVTLFNPILKPQLEQFWKAQEKILDESESFARHWFERRHEAARTGLGAARDAVSGDGPDPAAMMKVVADWQHHSAERMAEDTREWFDMLFRCASFVSETEAGAAEEMLDEGAKLARRATRSARSERV